MKKIVFVIESLHLGGAEKSLVTLLQNLDYSKFQVDLILFKTGGLFFGQLPANVKVIIQTPPQLSIFERAHYYLLRILNLAKLHNAQLFWKVIANKFNPKIIQYDIAIAYNQGFATYYVSDFIKAPIKYAWVNIDYKKAGYDVTFDYKFYKNFNQIITVSEEAHKAIEGELKKIKSDLPVTVIKDITDKEIVQKLADHKSDIIFPSNKLIIVTVGRLVKQKGLHLAALSCKLLIEKGHAINWYVVGEGSERNYLEGLINKHKLEKSFFLIGAKENPYPYIKNADIYVQTSLYEGLGLAVIEATYLNKPIVSTNFESVYSLFKEEETGLIAEMDEKSITEKIERLLIDKKLRERFSTNLAQLKNMDKELSRHKINNLLNS